VDGNVFGVMIFLGDVRRQAEDSSGGFWTRHENSSRKRPDNNSGYWILDTGCWMLDD
jgi:hypothetical protein